MHELSISRNIVAIVGDAARGKRVTRITLEIGRQSGVMAHAVEFCFELAAEGTPAARAVLDIRETVGDELNIKSIDLED
jgi:hydrogenase nickel incorporation protein HypA/HybF